SERLAALAPKLSIHVLTAGTHGTAATALAGMPCVLEIIGRTDQPEAKRRFIAALGADRLLAIGNGPHDRAMPAEARLAAAVVPSEGASGETLAAADLIVPTIVDALDLLTHPMRLVASLRD